MVQKIPHCKRCGKKLLMSIYSGDWYCYDCDIKKEEKKNG